MSSGAYARSGVDTEQADRALSRLVLEISPTLAFGAPSELGVARFHAENHVEVLGGAKLQPHIAHDQVARSTADQHVPISEILEVFTKKVQASYHGTSSST